MIFAKEDSNSSPLETERKILYSANIVVTHPTQIDSESYFLLNSYNSVVEFTSSGGYKCDTAFLNSASLPASPDAIEKFS